MAYHAGRFRIVTFILATLQLASPGMVAWADGTWAMATRGSPATHVEAVTQAACPEVHSPDCALCRYLSLSASRDSSALTFVAWKDKRDGAHGADEAIRAAASCVLPLGRAPPTV